MKNKKNIFISIAVIIALFVAIAYFYKSKENEKYKKLALEEALLYQKPHSFVIGKEDAKVQLVEFFDPACETCAHFHFLLKDVMKENPEIKLVLRYAPYHKNANYAVMMLEGAREQGLFIETLDLMLRSQNLWTVNHVVDPDRLWHLLINNLEKLDAEKLAAYMKSGKAETIIAQDMQDAEKLGANKTPSYFVNGKPLVQFGFENLIQLIDSQM